MAIQVEPDRAQELLDVMESVLLRLQFPRCTSRKNVIGPGVTHIEAMCWGLSPVFGPGNGPRADLGRAIRPFEEEAGILARAASQMVEGAEFTSIQLNKDYASTIHVDKNNVGESLILGLGDYTGGELWVYDPKGRVPMEVTRAVPGWPKLKIGSIVTGTIHDVKRTWVRFDGRRPHATMPIEGSRYTLIFFTTEWGSRAPGAALGKLQALGYPLPPYLKNMALADTGGRTESFSHVVLEEETVESMLELELPTEEYYEELGRHMRETHPDADPFVLEHFHALESLLDVAIVTGFSFGTAKASLLQTEVKVLGEIVGRESRRPTGEHVRAILEYPTPIPNIQELRRFLGIVNRVRLHEPAEYGSVVGEVNVYLGKKAPWLGEWPWMQQAGLDAVEALKKLTARITKLSAFDEVAALDGSRPLEQIADWCRKGWGGIVVQMARDRNRFHVLGQWSGPCSGPQQAYAAITGDFFAQRRTRQESRRSLGRVPAICWSDSKSGVSQANKSESTDVDVRHIRWLADLQSDGSVLKNLTARATWVRIADGLSRAQGLQSMDAQGRLSAELAERARRIREFRVEEVLNVQEAVGEIQADGLPGQQLPERLAESEEETKLRLQTYGHPSCTAIGRGPGARGSFRPSRKVHLGLCVAAVSYYTPASGLYPCDGPGPADKFLVRWAVVRFRECCWRSGGASQTAAEGPLGGGSARTPIRHRTRCNLGSRDRTGSCSCISPCKSAGVRAGAIPQMYISD